jgi:uncharacterized protein YdeI (YjbR/CyaY-like superfamily)
MSTDPRIDDYIARKPAFAQPILTHIRAAVHAACPDCDEAIKWGAPTFLYRGQIMIVMAAFKAHAALNFWHGKQLVEAGAARSDAMGQFGQLKSVADLPPADELDALIRKAVAVLGSDAKPVRTAKPKPPLETPAALQAALDANPAALATYTAFPPSCRRDYADWIAEAKRDETRAKRVAQAVEWLAEGKRRNWKYENC